MKLFSFPATALEKAIAKRMLTLEPGAREWFSERWAQKPYKKAFIEKKAMPLVIFIAKGKNWSDEEFEQELLDWDVNFYPAEVDVLRPIAEGEGMLQLMQKKVQPERLEKLLAHIQSRTISGTA
ncbi:hypothetical protein CK623_04150 [Vandammella animalimorsus]|uniref:Uncharacterized protein n=1 Tax=Vandammella animalimorsus TaxID=2029117 RepID=A0A2A2AL19_9BURK|nr:hypothetical protein [Vandammella animalimorsus]PAT36239.1 hypothetical protein CK620_03290 [Vandammella animalimorsus]PAT38339.1 hypothetical protein CK625_02280 [Vandammella animalimorsus]PAT40962.1 hypothetical protein CK623_04150 [Vandammella animalimorsus]RRD65966.1 hypothetical protein EII19_11125 [Comamonadaceae bacterium OH2310_COT-174]